MTTYSTNLLVPYLEDNQDDPHLPVNEAVRILDKAIGGLVTLDTTGGTYVVSDEESRGAYLKITGTLASNAVIQVPARAKQWIIQNAATVGTYTVTVKTASGTAVTIYNNGQRHLIYCDGTDCYYVQNPHAKNRVVLAYSATFSAWDWSGVDMFEITLTGNTVISNFAGAADGQICEAIIRQDGTGGWTVGWPSNVRYGSDLASITLSSSPNKMDRVGFQYDAVDAKYDAISLIRGF